MHPLYGCVVRMLSTVVAADTCQTPLKIWRGYQADGGESRNRNLAATGFRPPPIVPDMSLVALEIKWIYEQSLCGCQHQVC